MLKQPFVLVFVVFFLAWWLDFPWLATFLGIVAFFMIVAEVLPAKDATPQGNAQPEEVLTPVIVQDVGEAPYLYPPSFRLKLQPNWKAEQMWENASAGAGWLGGGIYNALRGRKMKLYGND